MSGQAFKVALMIVTNVLVSTLHAVQAQSSSISASWTLNSGGMRAGIYSGDGGAGTSTGMVAVTLPTQVMLNGGLQILTPEYRVLSLSAGTFLVDGGQVFADPAALRAAGYPQALIPDVVTEIAPIATSQVNVLPVVGPDDPVVATPDRKVLSYIPGAGTVFGYGAPDPTYGTRGALGVEQVCDTTARSVMARLSGDVAFDAGQAEVKPAASVVLDQLAAQMIAKAGASFTLTGHSDSQGSASYNQTLSQRRAQAVKDYLAGKGVAEEAMSVVGVGEEQPIASNDTAEGRAQNRRVEIASVGGLTTVGTNCPSDPVADRSALVSSSQPLPVDNSFMTVNSSTYAPSPTMGSASFASPSFSDTIYTPPSFETSPMMGSGLSDSSGYGAIGAVPNPISAPASAAVFLGAAQPSGIPQTANLNATNVFIPDSGSNGATDTVLAGNDAFAQLNQAAEEQGFLGGIQQSVSDTPWFVWAGGAAAAAAVAFFIFSSGNANAN